MPGSFAKIILAVYRSEVAWYISLVLTVEDVDVAQFDPQLSDSIHLIGLHPRFGTLILQRLFFPSSRQHIVDTRFQDPARNRILG